MTGSENLTFVLAAILFVGATVTAIAIGLITWRVKIDRLVERRVFRALSKECCK